MTLTSQILELLPATLGEIATELSISRKRANALLWKLKETERAHRTNAKMERDPDVRGGRLPHLWKSGPNPKKAIVHLANGQT